MDIFKLLGGLGGGNELNPAMAAALMGGMGGQRRGPLAQMAPNAPQPGGSPGFNAAFAGMEQGAGPLPQPPRPQFMSDPGPMERPQVGPLQVDTPQVGRRGVFDRVGDFIGSDEGKGALLRAGASLLGGGSVGDAIMTGADFVDGRKAQRLEAERYDREMGQKDRSLDISQQATDQTGLYQAGQLRNTANANMVDLLRAQESARANAAREGIDWAKLTQQQQQFLVESQLEIMKEEGRQERHYTPSGSTVYTQEQANARHSTPSASSLASSGGAGPKLGSVVVENKGREAVEPGWFTSGSPGVPSSRTTYNLLPLPADPAGRIPGATYQTPNGPARWTGSTWQPL